MDGLLAERIRPLIPPSSTLPTEQDEACSRALAAYLDAHAPLESEEAMRKRKYILLDLRDLMAEWVKHVAVSQHGIPEEDAKPGRLFVSGSSRLGVNQEGADIDTILVVPQFIRREDFFDEAESGLLHRIRTNPNVSHVLPIATARVPLIEVVWSGVELDVLFARLEQMHVPGERNPDELLDDALLLKADEATILSLNGPRVTEMLIKMVPHYPTFCLVLRGLRLWGKKRGIYSNKMGFLGGVNFAILAAFACRMWPKETASRCLTRLMELVVMWNWPNPIRLCLPWEVDNAIGNPSLAHWDPRNGRDKMPIITPAFPNFNSSLSVTNFTFDIMLEEFDKGHKDAERVMRKGVGCEAEDWQAFFAPTDFFFRFKVYVVVVTRAHDALGLKKWSGFVESRIRSLVQLMERLPLSKVFPLAVGFDLESANSSSSGSSSNNNDKGEAEVGRRWFIGIRVNADVARMRNYNNSFTVNLEGAVGSFLQHVIQWPEREDSMTIDVSICKFKDMVRLCPSLYESEPGGIEGAFKRHRAIQDELHGKNAAAATTAATPAAATTTSVVATQQQQQNPATLLPDVMGDGLAQSRRRALDHVDLNELASIPVNVIDYQQNAGGSAPPPPARPQAFKVVVLS